MSGFHETHSAPSTTTASAPSTATLTKPDASASSSPAYQHYTTNPAAHTHHAHSHSHTHSTYRHAHDGLSPHAHQNGNVKNVPRHGQPAVSYAHAHSTTNNLTAALHAVADVHGQDPAAASPSLQYSPGAHHDLHTPAHSGSASPTNKKNTRIPRACDLCSQRKVKVGHQLCYGTTPHPARSC